MAICPSCAVKRISATPSCRARRSPLRAARHVRRSDHLEEVVRDVANPAAGRAPEPAAVAAPVLDTYGEPAFRAGSRRADEQRGAPTAELRLEDQRPAGSSLQDQGGDRSMRTRAVGVLEPGSSGAPPGGPGGRGQYEGLP